MEEANRKANKQPGLPAGPWGSVDPYLPTPITTTPAPTVSPSRGEDEGKWEWTWEEIGLAGMASFVLFLLLLIALVLAAVLARAALTDSFQATCAQCMRCHENVRSILMMASRVRSGRRSKSTDSSSHPSFLPSLFQARQYAEPAGDEEMVEMGRAGNVDVEVEVDEETGETSAPQSMSMNNLLRKEEAEDQSVAASSPMATEVPVATSTPSIIKRKTPE